MRALEVFFQTGKSITELQPNRVEPPEFASRIKIFALNPPRDLLYERINTRAEQHFADGLVEEVKLIRASGVNDDTNALGAHGYRRVCEFLRGERTLEMAIEQTKLDVRHYAKRQLTWFRHKEGVTWLDGFGDEVETQKILWKILQI
jgi:tRNA dimethylallyltransferase